ncbi:hypothetical protein [Actinomadura geliboluensis]|uniref:Uncharacterized protein n=1 Tax=Actinomadura geliboluensis TaxID=882440 RepID=A0A5S4G2K5_9ACTN|nr:hypothetical protein [Actinomadura geliboluensis]TMR26631.1 hypothetical protein ETD96_40870 [Actinomadura geliboluensis]
MVARVRVLRPRPRFAVVPAPSSPSASSSSVVSSWDVWPVGVEWDEFRSLHVARCQRCAESFASSSCGEVDAWAEIHWCDAELAALLALVDVRRAA